MAPEIKPARARIVWEGDSREVLQRWPKPIKLDFGGALDALQSGETPVIPIRSMSSIGAGVFELKDGDENHWYRLVYLAKIGNTIHVLHCFKKQSGKTSQRDLDVAEKRLKEVRTKLMEERRDAKQKGHKP